MDRSKKQEMEILKQQLRQATRDTQQENQAMREGITVQNPQIQALEASATVVRLQRNKGSSNLM